MPPNNYGVVCADGSIVTMAEFVGVGTATQQQLLLAPGEIVRNSGKFAKPTRIPGKNYCKDEIVIRNADSGKGKCFYLYTIPFHSSPSTVDPLMESLIPRIPLNWVCSSVIGYWIPSDVCILMMLLMSFCY